jgi:hypothetical protein
MRAALLVAWLWMVTTAAPARAQVGVFPVDATNLSEGEATAIGRLIASAYAFQIGKPVLPPEQVEPALARTGSERQAALQLGLDEYISVQAVRLSQHVSLSVTLHDRHGNALFRLRTTALSLDDMEVVSERIAVALVRRTDTKYTRSIDTITGKEARAGNRLFLEKIFGLRTAVIQPLAKHLHSTAALSLMFDGRLETDDYFLEFGAGFLVPSGARSSSLAALMLQFGASYYLTHSSVSPYLGVGASPRIMLGDYAGTALTVNAQLGLMFMRESSTRMYVELRVDQHLLPLNSGWSDSSDLPYTGPSVRPTEFGFAAGIGW